MEEAKLKDMLRGSGRGPAWTGRGCPAEQCLAAFAEQRLGGSERAAVESHLSDCDFCRGQVSFLVKAVEWPEPAAVPHHLLREARGLVAEKRRAQTLWGWRWAGAAVAACLILTAGILIALRSGRPGVARTDEPLVARIEPLNAPPVVAQANSSPAGLQTPAATPGAYPRPTPTESKPKQAQPQAPAAQNRGAEIQGLSPTLLSPREGAMLSRGDLEFRWEPVPEAVFYEVSIVTAAGDSAYVKRTESTRLRLPDDISLVSGAKYYVSVRVYLREGKTAKSGFMSFHVLN
jgi:hypothetical protein